jgi:methionyl-tRNA formyltransferase
MKIDGRRCVILTGFGYNWNCLTRESLLNYFKDRALVVSQISRAPRPYERRGISSEQEWFDHAQVKRLTGRLPISIDTVNSPLFIELCASFKADILFTVGYGEIISAATIEACTPVLNFHPSLLPNFRGSNPIPHQLLESVNESGITLHYVDSRVDTGNIIKQARFRVNSELTETSLSTLCGLASIRLIQELCEEGLSEGVPQGQECTAVSKHIKEDKLQFRLNDLDSLYHYSRSTNLSYYCSVIEEGGNTLFEVDKVIRIPLLDQFQYKQFRKSSFIINRKCLQIIDTQYVYEIHLKNNIDNSWSVILDNVKSAGYTNAW